MPTDGLVEPVEDRPCGEQVLGGAEGPLDGSQMLVAQHRSQRIEVSVGAQHEHAVEFGVCLGLRAMMAKWSSPTVLRKRR
jgi:hypothetical protein